MSTPSNLQIKPTVTPTPLNLSTITSAPETPHPTIEQNPLSLPPASLFTFLPDLYVLISRLSELRNPPADLLNYPGHGQSDTLTQIVSRDSNASLRLVGSAEGSIEVRELPGFVFAVKRRIGEARSVVEELQGGERTVEEQEGEMRVLRGRIEGVKRRLEEIGGICRGSEDVVMQGVEE